MRRNNAVSTLAVIAFWAVAATSAWAEPSGVNYRWGGSTPTQVVVDGEYAKEHPEQIGLQGVVVDTRTRVALVEGRVNALEQNTPPAENPATMNMNGPGTTINNTVYPPPYTPPAPSGNPPPSGGPAANTQPVQPAQGGNGMVTAIEALAVAAGLVFLFVWGIPAITEAARRRKRENDIELQEMKTAANEAEVASQAAAFDMLRQEVRPGERATYDGYVRAGGRLIGRRNGVMEYANPAPVLANNGNAGNGGGGGGNAPTQAITNLAAASLARPTSAVPAGAAAVAAARVIAYSDAKRDVLALAIAGLPILDNDSVDLVRDQLIQLGQIAP